MKYTFDTVDGPKEAEIAYDKLPVDFLLELVNRKDPDAKAELIRRAEEFDKSSEEVINLDDNDANADWIKTNSWDLPTTLDEFVQVVTPDKWEHFKELPAYSSMPESLEKEVDEYMKTHKEKGSTNTSNKEDK